MSNKTPNEAALQSTRQMLDELDSLMERMLSLPVNDLEDAPPFPKEVVSAPTLAATLTLLQPPAPGPTMVELPAPPPHPPLNPPHLTMPPAAPELDLTFEAPQPPPLTNDVVPPSLLPKLEARLADIPVTPAPRVEQWGYRPLLWINRRFDHATILLGRAGHRLRSQNGRMALGLSGAGLLLMSAGWYLKDCLGWNW